MKKTITAAAIVAALFLAAPAIAAIETSTTSLTLDGRTALVFPSTFKYKIEGTYTQDLSKIVGLFVFFEASRTYGQDVGYGQVQVGPSFVIAKWLNLGIGLGLESPAQQLRLVSFFRVKWDRWAASLTAEKGGTGYYYNARAGFKATDLLTLGVMLQKGYGLGPRLDIAIGKTPFSIWLAGGIYNPETALPSLQLALRYATK